MLIVNIIGMSKIHNEGLEILIVLYLGLLVNIYKIFQELTKIVTLFAYLTNCVFYINWENFF